MTQLQKVLLTLWAVLQLGRLIAVPLIRSVAAGTDAPAWMFPALVDVVVAAGVPVAIWAIWRGNRFGAWLYLVLWMALSIFDHASAVTAFRMAGVPGVFEGFGDPGLAVPMVQALVDALVIWLLCRPAQRRGFRLEA